MNKEEEEKTAGESPEKMRIRLLRCRKRGKEGGQGVFNEGGSREPAKTWMGEAEVIM